MDLSRKEVDEIVRDHTNALGCNTFFWLVVLLVCLLIPLVIIRWDVKELRQQMEQLNKSK